MAKRKLTLQLPPSTPRNPLVVPALGRHAGAHGSSRKAERQQARQKVQRHLAGLLLGEKSAADLD